MKSRVAIKDHPVHPMLVSLPLGLLTGSLAADLIGLASGNRRFNGAAQKMKVGGLATGLLAAVPGLIDYLTVVPPDSEAEDVGRAHLIGNLAVMGLFGASAIVRARSKGLPAPITLSFLGFGTMMYAAWMGGSLVYRHQIAVDHLAAEGNEHLVLPKCEAIVGDWVPVCGVNDLKKGQIALITINDQRVALARLDEERFAAFADSCTHAGGPLSDGTLIGESVQCPWHGSQFNVCSGRVECGPADEPIPTYEVRVQGDRLQVRAPAHVRRSLVQAGSLS